MRIKMFLDGEELIYSCALPHQLKQRIQNRCNQNKNHIMKSHLNLKRPETNKGKGKAQSLNALVMFGHLNKPSWQIYFSLFFH